MPEPNGGGPSGPGGPAYAARVVEAARVLAIVPAFNEEVSIGATLDELFRTVNDVDVVVIDDGSSDATVDIARAHGATVLELPFNLGIGGALRTGFRWAVQQGYQRAFQFDADGQHDPREIAALLEPLAHGADMVVGSRFHTGDVGYTVSRVRRSAMASLRMVLRLLIRQSFTDTSSGFRAFNRRMLVFFGANYPAEYMESVEALFLACSEGFTVAEVPARMRSRAGGQPSTRRLRLIYHYLRLHIVLLASVRRRREQVMVAEEGA
jgi:glycosyltransferase involved in cell wall biosynthesis